MTEQVESVVAGAFTEALLIAVRNDPAILNDAERMKMAVHKLLTANAREIVSEYGIDLAEKAAGCCMAMLRKKKAAASKRGKKSEAAVSEKPMPVELPKK